MYGDGLGADVRVAYRREKKRPERTTSVPCHCIDGQWPGRGADPRYPLGPPLMLSPVALPEPMPLMESRASVPLIVPSGQEETYGPPRRPAIGLSTDGPGARPRMRRVFHAPSTTGRKRLPIANSRGDKQIPKLLHGPRSPR